MKTNKDLSSLTFMELLDEFYRSHDAVMALWVWAPEADKLFWRTLDACHQTQKILGYNYDRVADRQKFDDLIMLSACGFLVSIWYSDELKEWWEKNGLVVDSLKKKVAEEKGYNDRVVYDEGPRTLVWAFQVGNELVRRIREGDPTLPEEQREKLLSESGFIEAFEKEKRACIRAIKAIVEGKVES